MIKYNYSTTSTVLKSIEVCIESIEDIKDGILNIKIPAAIEGIKFNSIGSISQVHGAALKLEKDSHKKYFSKIKVINIEFENGPKRIRTFINNNMNCPSAYINCTIPDSIEQLGPNFITSSEINDLKFNKKCKNIEDFCFYNSCFRNKLVIPDSIKTIEFSAFKNAFFKDTLFFSNNSNLKKIGNEAFEASEFSQTSLRLPENVNSIGTEAFYLCEGISSISGNFKKALIQHAAFASFTSLTNIIFEGEIQLEMNAFQENNHLKTVDFSKADIKQIPCYCFYKCHDLESILLPPNLEVIENQAFFNTQLKEITFPSTLKILRDKAFYGSSLTNITFAENESFIEEIGNGVFIGNYLTNLPPDIISKCKRIGEEAFKANRFVELTLIAPPSFVGGISLFTCNNWLEKVSLVNDKHNEWKYIPKSMFSSCKNLTEIQIPNSVTEIKGHSFYNTNIKSFKAPKNLIYIRASAFHNCVNLRTVDLKDSNIKTIGLKAFSATSLSHLILPDYFGEIKLKSFNLTKEEVSKIIEGKFYYIK